MIYDVAIIGAGVTGAMTARALAKFDIKVVLIEKCNDVAMGATKANSGIVHAGFDAKTGSNKARLNVRGCAMMKKTCEMLDVPYKNNGSLVVAFDDEEKAHLQKLYDRGIANGVGGMKIIDADELRSLEPNISPNAVAALYAETAGIVCPYELTIAAAECAVANGVEFMRNTEVLKIESKPDYLRLLTSVGELRAKFVINAAGVFADRIAAMADDDTFKITARSGDYFLLDRNVGDMVSHTIFQCPTVMGKGVLVANTVDGNIIMGPTAGDVNDKEDVSTRWEDLNHVKELSVKSVPLATPANAITSFSGLRAHSSTGDFIIGISEKNPRLINAAGIESPGLSAAPALAEEMADIVKELLDAKERTDYDPTREHPVRFRHMTDDEREELIKKNPAYGHIICRCETVTEGEIIDAIRAPAGARDVDGVKRRTRAGMGRCQGGFCGSKVAEILAAELNKDLKKITKFGGRSNIVVGKTK